MKYLFLLVIPVLANTNYCLSQKPEKATFKILYEGYTSFGPQKTTEHKYNSIVLGNQNIVACWQGLKKNYSEKKNDSFFTIKSTGTYSGLINRNYKENKLYFAYSSALLKDKHNIYSDTLRPFTWEITPLEKKIDTLTCFKAITVYRGRAFVAWFAPSIPISEGPWKFFGLPGLIIELYDDEREIYWKLQSFQNSEEIIPRTGVAKGNFNLFVNEMKEGYKRLAAFMQAGDNIDPTCLTCKKDLKIKIYTTENILEY